MSWYIVRVLLGRCSCEDTKSCSSSDVIASERQEANLVGAQRDIEHDHAAVLIEAMHVGGVLAVLVESVVPPTVVRVGRASIAAHPIEWVHAGRLGCLPVARDAHARMLVRMERQHLRLWLLVGYQSRHLAGRWVRFVLELDDCDIDAWH